MKKWARQLAKAAVGLALLASALIATAFWAGNRELAPATMAERQQSYQRALSWVRVHEADLLKDSNVALWSFIQKAAERTGDDYLKALMAKYMEAFKKSDSATSPWRRMVDPTAEVTFNADDLQILAPYQRFFYHALTCRPVALDDGDTSVFLKNGVCHPAFTQVWLKDPACTTHHLVGVMLLQSVGCVSRSELLTLENDLLADIQQQMRWDVVVKDAYLQRLMLLMWYGKSEQVKPVWLKRVLQAQQPDGGWVGGRQFPELPEWAQPWLMRSKLAVWWPSHFNSVNASDFHATAQGLLIAALALTENQK